MTDINIDTVARREIRNAVTIWQEHGWEDALPDVGEYDYQRVCDRMLELLPLDTTTDGYCEAYQVLADRAEKEIE